MENGIRGNLFSVAAVISICAAAALIVCTFVVASTYRARLETPKKMEQSLAVTGSARRRIRSDLAVWQIHLCGKGADLKAGYAALKSSSDRVSSFLQARKFTPDEIALSAISSEPEYAKNRRGETTSEVAGYILRRSFTISTTRVDVAASAASEVTELIQEGLEISSQMPEYYYTKISDLKVEMIGEAARDARSRADQIVTQAGCQIAEVRSARMGVLQITRPNSTEVSAGGVHDTSTVEKDVTSVVSLTFGLAN